MTGRNYLRFLRESWLIVLTCAVLAAAIGAVVTFAKKPVYESISTLAVSTCVAMENSANCDPVGGITFAIQRAKIYSAAASGLPVQRKTLELTDVVSNRKELNGQVDVRHEPDSPVITVKATWTTPNGAAELSNAMSQALVEYALEAIDNFEGSSNASVSFSVVAPASTPTEPVDSATDIVSLALALGLLAGVGIALLRFLSDQRIKDRDEVEALASTSVLCEMPSASLTSDASADKTDHFRMLRAIVAPRVAKSEITILAITSPDRADSSREIARALTAAFTEAGVNAVHVDGMNVQTRQPHNAFVGVGTSIHSTIPVEPISGSPSSPLSTAEYFDLIRDLTARFDLLLVSTPPLLGAADSLTIASVANAAIITVEKRVSRRPHVTQAVKLLGLADTPVLGAVLIS